MVALRNKTASSRKSGSETAAVLAASGAEDKNESDD